MDDFCPPKLSDGICASPKIPVVDNLSLFNNVVVHVVNQIFHHYLLIYTHFVPFTYLDFYIMHSCPYSIMTYIIIY